MSNELRASLRCEIDTWVLQDIARPPMWIGRDNEIFGGPGRVREEGSIEPDRGETKTGLETK